MGASISVFVGQTLMLAAVRLPRSMSYIDNGYVAATEPKRVEAKTRRQCELVGITLGATETTDTVLGMKFDLANGTVQLAEKFLERHTKFLQRFKHGVDNRHGVNKLVDVERVWHYDLRVDGDARGAGLLCAGAEVLKPSGASTGRLERRSATDDIGRARVCRRHCAVRPGESRRFIAGQGKSSSNS